MCAAPRLRSSELFPSSISSSLSSLSRAESDDDRASCTSHTSSGGTRHRPNCSKPAPPASFGYPSPPLPGPTKASFDWGVRQRSANTTADSVDQRSLQELLLTQFPPTIIKATAPHRTTSSASVMRPSRPHTSTGLVSTTGRRATGVTSTRQQQPGALLEHPSIKLAPSPPRSVPPPVSRQQAPVVRPRETRATELRRLKTALTRTCLMSQAPTGRPVIPELSQLLRSLPLSDFGIQATTPGSARQQQQRTTTNHSTTTSLDRVSLGDTRPSKGSRYWPTPSGSRHGGLSPPPTPEQHGTALAYMHGSRLAQTTAPRSARPLAQQQRQSTMPTHRMPPQQEWTGTSPLVTSPKGGCDTHAARGGWNATHRGHRPLGVPRPNTYLSGSTEASTVPRGGPPEMQHRGRPRCSNSVASPPEAPPTHARDAASLSPVPVPERSEKKKEKKPPATKKQKKKSSQPVEETKDADLPYIHTAP